MSKRNVFLFGAGASKEEGGLLSSELLLKALNHPEVNSRYRYMIERFLKDIFRTAEISNETKIEQLPTFEEFLTLVDIALLKREEFSNYWTTKRLRELREALIYSIAWILKMELRPGPTPRPQYHRNLVRNIFYNNRDLDPSNFSFMSLNYDILLDNALLDLYPRWDVDYCLNLRNYTIDNDFNKPRKGYEIKLLKLHGSLNWMFCPVCNSVRLNTGGKIADKIIERRIKCEVDHAIQRPLLIPPTWLKIYDSIHLSKIWFEAENLLRKADRVFFIGCSFAESDFHVRYLAIKSLYRKRQAPEIVVVTRETNVEGSELDLRYKRNFGSIKLLPIGFGTFSEVVNEHLD